MKATVTLICSKCGKQFVMEKGVETEEKNEAGSSGQKTPTRAHIVLSAGSNLGLMLIRLDIKKER